jgi:hypothetical protein
MKLMSIEEKVVITWWLVCIAITANASITEYTRLQLQNFCFSSSIALLPPLSIVGIVLDLYIIEICKSEDHLLKGEYLFISPVLVIHYDSEVIRFSHLGEDPTVILFIVAVLIEVHESKVGSEKGN